MKLAEALVRRADLQKRVEGFRTRLKNNAKVQAGDKPAEDPQALLSALEVDLSELARLIFRINKTNLSITVQAGQTMTESLAQRDKLKQWRSVLMDLIAASAIMHDRHTRSEVRFRRTVRVPEIRKQADRLAHDFRDLDTAIQRANWNNELAD